MALSPSPSPHPFANPSPPPVRRRMSALPSSTSESHLARTSRAAPQPKPPAQPTKVRPFILRGSSAPSRTGDGRVPAVETRAKGKEKAEDAVATLRKSKTSVEIAPQAASARASEPDKVEKERRRRSVAVRSELALTPTRADYDGSSAPSKRLSLSPAVEAQKAALKRRTLAARQGVDSLDAQPAASGMKRSGRWFGRLSSVAGAGNAQDEAEVIPPVRARTPPATKAPSARVTALDAPDDPPATPPLPAAGVCGPAKKASYTALGRGRVVRATSPTPGAKAEDVKEGTGAGFASLQELLEKNGYADTRVITPQAHKVRPAGFAVPVDGVQADPSSSCAPASAPSGAAVAASLAPEAQTQPTGGKGLKQRSSLLSLRGWFSLFSPAPESEEGGDEEDEVEVLADHVAVAATESPQPRMRSASEMLHWVEGVAEAYPPPPSAPHPLSHSSLPLATSASSLEATPQLVQYRSHADDDSASARSYSSSLSLDYSPPTPHHPLPLVHAQSFCPTIAISPDADSPLKARAGKSSGNSLVLRHAASDSRLLLSPSFTSFPAYESFSGLGISVPSPSASCAPTPPSHTPQRVATPPPAPGMFSSMWVPSLLRERASQLFSHAASPAATAGASSSSSAGAFASPFDAATGLSPSQRRLLTAAHAQVHGRAPKLLRKAVSAGGLRVAAQGRVTRARVEAKSSRESLGSLEAAPVPVVGAEEAVASAWGEDLLGRRW
ncbi:hypothetical protein JCM10449v2_007005 [Rhodotorula kratochvilovae]